jgi:DNA mismatch repair protein MutS
VARLAGLPQKVITRAREILSNLEKGELDALGLPKIATTKISTLKPKPPLQPSLFDQPDPIRSELKKIKTDQLTPLDALNILDELKKKAEKED